MAFEPNKKIFLERLKSINFDISTVAKDTDALQEIFWYFDGNRDWEIVEDILNPVLTTPEDAKQIITNLAKIYPLSRTVIMKIMIDSRAPKYSDEYFLIGFDVAKKVRAEILSVFKEVEEQLFRLTKATNDYRRSLIKLNAEYEKLEIQAQELQELRAERDYLQQQVDQLREDTKQETLKNKIEELQVEKNQLESEKHRQQSEIEQRQKNILKLKAELTDLAKKLNPSEELQMIRELLKKFPVDAEG